MINGLNNHYVKGILEYAAFFNVVINCYFEDQQKCLSMRVIEVMDVKFILVPIDRDMYLNSLTQTKEKKVRMFMQYQGKGLKFEAFILHAMKNVSEINDIEYHFLIPKEMVSFENRVCERVDVKNNTQNLRAELVIKKGDLKLKVESQDIINISKDSLGVHLRVEHRVFSIGDNVELLKLFNGKRLVLISNGVIIRIRDRNKIDKQTSFFAIQFSKSQYDLDNEEISLFNDRRVADRRLVFSDDTSAFVEFPHPIFNEIKLIGIIKNISTSGITFALTNPKFPFLPGMFLRNFQIQLPKATRHNANLRVIHINNGKETDSDVIQIGCEFSGMEINLVKEISSKMSQSLIPNIMEATIEDLDNIWEFFFETGFLYQSKQIQMKKNAKKIRHTSLRLLSADNKIANVVLYKESGGIRGHISAVRFFDSTWIVQHLTAKRSSDSVIAGRAMIEGMIAFFRNPKANDLVNSKYLTCYYRPNNTYPATVFGGVRTIINEKDICDSTELRFCLLKDSREIQFSSATTEAPRVANISDLNILENILKDHDHKFLIHSEDLYVDKFTDLYVSGDFDQLGLYRKRKIFTILSKKSGTQIFAICNYASPGINLSELTNSFRIVSKNQDAKDYLLLLNALVTLVCDTYKKTEVDSPVLLLEPHQLLPTLFRDEKVYIHWCLNLNYMALFKSAIEVVFSDFRQYVKSQKNVKENS